MRVLIVDDKQLAASSLASTLQRIEPQCEAEYSSNAADALKLMSKNHFDVMFIDIKMPGMNGLELACRAKEANADTNIIFVTGHPNYALEAHGLYPSGFLVKPATDEEVRRALENLRHPVRRSSDAKVRVQCFGNFDVFDAEGTPLMFERTKTLELFAYLVDRRGARCKVDEVVAVLWGDAAAPTKRTQLRALVCDLRAALKRVGAEDIIVKSRGLLAVNPQAFECDLYDFLCADPYAIRKYRGEYMAQYSWAEMTNGLLAVDFIDFKE